MEETLAMTKKELDRIKVLSQVIESKSSQVLAAKKLGISDRQVRAHGKNQALVFAMSHIIHL